ncbi:MAG: histone deacetylase family protein [Gammaproteobacteria bacterium]|nr:histone deacetylase family protein [Gammaproteobacteria bacterium]MDH3466365.1 histone deacetylase family protein [Gammaproteobacteria bacterium]
MRAIHNPAADRHAPRFFLVRGQIADSAESPARATALSAALVAGGHTLSLADSHGAAPRAAVHTTEYLAFLASAHDRWSELAGSGHEVISNVHPNRHTAAYPQSIVGQAGWHMADTACPIGSGTFEAACFAADVAVTAAQALMDGERVVYGLCRPPGHHAFTDMAGGFCYLNNTSIAAQYLRGGYPRVAIIDVDVHHGNGTQSIFYRRADVLTISIHTDPSHYYPFYWGYGNEHGAGAGEGFNVNYPLPQGANDSQWMGALGKALNVVAAYGPDAMVVALGLDAHEHDPLHGAHVTTTGFWRMGAAFAELELPTLIIQEGGYLSSELGANLLAFLGGFEEA